MAGSFETSDDHKSRNHKPIRVPILKGDVLSSAKEMVADLDGWELVAEDDAAGTLTCRRRGGLLTGESTVTVRVEGPDGIPSSTVHVRSESQGKLLSRDKQNVAEFVRPFFRRVC